MAASLSVTELKVENFVYPPTLKAPGSDKTLVLAGAGVRGLEIQGKFIKFTTMALYFEENAIPALTTKWKSKTVGELADSDEFYHDIVTGQFEKFLHVTTILPITGQQYSEKVSGQCIEILKSLGIYTEKEAKAIEKFVETFKDENFPPGHSILFTLSPIGSLTIAFSKHDSIPENGVVINNKNLVETITDCAIGKNGVSPATKQSLAVRISELLNKGSC